MRARVAVGVGCRRNCPSDNVLAVIRDACGNIDLRDAALFSHAAKTDEPGLHAAAATLGIPLAFLDAAALAAVVDRVTHRSARVEAAVGVRSVAEAAALVGAGPGSRLVVPRVAHAAATCAVALAAGAEA